MKKFILVAVAVVLIAGALCVRYFTKSYSSNAMAATECVMIMETESDGTILTSSYNNYNEILTLNRRRPKVKKQGIPNFNLPFPKVGKR